MNQKKLIKIIAVIGTGIVVGVLGYFVVNPSVSYQNLDARALSYVSVNEIKLNASKLNWDEKIEIASGDAFRGAWRMNQSAFHYVDDATVALTDKGLVAVAWVDQSRKDVFFQRYQTDGKPQFGKPVNVSTSPHIFSWLPRMVMAADDANKVYILWQEIVFSGGSHGGEIFFARSTDAGRTFSEPLNLSNSTAGEGKGRLTKNHWHNGSLDIVMGPEGNLYVAWTAFGGALHVTRSIDGGVNFSTPIHISGGGTVAPTRGPSLAVDGKGVVYLAWTATEARGGGIRLTKSVDFAHTFSKPDTLFNSSGHADAPKIAVDSKGVIHLLYAQSPEGLFRPYHIRYSRSSDGGQSFEKSKKISTNMDTKFASESFPMLDIDGDNKLYVTWELFPGQARRSRGLGFTFSSDGGQTFAVPSVVPGSAAPALGVNGSQQGLLMNKLDVNKTGTIAIVNSTFLSNESSHIWLHLGEITGD